MPSDFEFDVLGVVANDYEAVHTIRGDLERDQGKEISEEELFAALANLATAGLVDVFEYNHSQNGFEKVPPSILSKEKEFWFLANSNGLATYERYNA